jgi:hypothetical protein
MSISNIKPIISNRRTSNYNLQTDDKIQIKLALNLNGKISYLNNVPVEMYFNFTGEYIKYVDTFTNKFGIVDIIYPCTDLLMNINNALGYAKVVYNNQEYVSNIIRINFNPGYERSYELLLYPNNIMLYSSNIIIM